MLQDADIAMIQTDTALPGLRLLLDTQALLETLRRLPRFADTRSLTVTYLRYKPRTSCVAGLTLVSASGEQGHYYAKALTTERFMQTWHRRRYQTLVSTEDPYAPAALAAFSLILFHPLNDPVFSHLRPLYLQSAANALCGLWPFAQSAILTWQLLRYKPERRFVAALNTPEGRHAVLRCCHSETFGAMLAGASLGEALGHTRMLGHDVGHRLLLTQWQAGDILCPEQHAQWRPGDLGPVGETLATTHQTALTLSTRRTLQDEIQALWNVLNTLSFIYPAGEARFRQLTQRIAQALLPGKSAPALIHGDFSLDQVVHVADRTLCFLDWDHAAYGDPLTDLASLQARLELQAIEQVVTHAQADLAVSCFLSGYTARAAPDVRQSLSQLTWHVAAKLLCLATEPFRKRAPHWPEQIEALLTRAAHYVAQAQTSTLHIPTDRLLTLTDPSAIEKPMRQALSLPESAQWVKAEVIRHKLGRRALIAYQWSLPGQTAPMTVLGKYRAKGVDHAAFNKQRALWQNGFNASSWVSVPEPLALMEAEQLWLQRKISARLLTELLHPASHDLSILGNRVAMALAALHQSQALRALSAAKQWRLSDEVAVLRQRLNQAAALRPRWSARIKQVLAGCEQLAASLIPSESTVIHRDFYPDQVMIYAEPPFKVALLDFDLCCIGCPAIDAGNYIAHVQELALRQFGDIQALAAHESAFLQAFLARSPTVAAEEIQALTTLSLARHIFLSTQFPARAQTTAALLYRCEARLGVRSG
ncbi:aminoglycoside phosphotransferase family protein [Brenneria rubrifaciens]|nr:aminoglycoside phosphotransferase family protein [Brenneria rubrifaciens]